VGGVVAANWCRLTAVAQPRNCNTCELLQLAETDLARLCASGGQEVPWWAENSSLAKETIHASEYVRVLSLLTPVALCIVAVRLGRSERTTGGAHCAVGTWLAAAVAATWVPACVSVSEGRRGGANPCNPPAHQPRQQQQQQQQQQQWEGCAVC
jgi:hypothetical protein